uniref:Uncharacterized protein n=1 Tax=Arundo donax TaxID=35708 RepID=A0A0A9GZQ6_ARUDO
MLQLPQACGRRGCGHPPRLLKPNGAFLPQEDPISRLRRARAHSMVRISGEDGRFQVPPVQGGGEGHACRPMSTPRSTT